MYISYLFPYFLSANYVICVFMFVDFNLLLWLMTSLS